MLPPHVEGKSQPLLNPYGAVPPLMHMSSSASQLPLAQMQVATYAQQPLAFPPPPPPDGSGGLALQQHGPATASTAAAAASTVAATGAPSPGLLSKPLSMAATQGMLSGSVPLARPSPTPLTQPVPQQQQQQRPT